MKNITFYLDFISPYAYLAFEQLPEALRGLNYSVRYRPVLLGALLRHHGQLGPAEIAPKRDWTYRHVLWSARQKNIALQLPALHPFNPLPLPRLALACSAEADIGAPNRYICETIFRHAWQGGADAVDKERLASLAQLLAPRGDAESEEVKAQLRNHTETALAQGIFGVPSFEVDNRVFWGMDALSMLRDYLLGGTWFEGGEWDDAASRPSGLNKG